MILREVLSAVMGESGFLVPDSFVGSASTDDVQMVYLANRAVTFLLEKGFQRLRKRYTITLTSATDYTMPSDFLELVSDTARINGRIETLNLPTNTPEWAYLKASAGPTNYVVKARILNNQLSIYSPTVGAVLSFEYIGKYAILATDGVTYKQRFTADTDGWLLDDDLLILETRWRFEKAKGIENWQATEQECTEYRNSVMGRDNSSQTILGEPEAYSGEPYTRQWI